MAKKSEAKPAHAPTKAVVKSDGDANLQREDNAERQCGTSHLSANEPPPTSNSRRPYDHLLNALGVKPAENSARALRDLIEPVVIDAIQGVNDAVLSMAEDIAVFEAAWGKEDGLPESMVSATWKMNRAKEAVRIFFSSAETEFSLKSAVALRDAMIGDSAKTLAEQSRQYEQAVKAIFVRAMEVAKAAISSALKGHQYPNPMIDDGHYTPAELEERYRIDPTLSKNFRKALLRKRTKNLFSDDYRELNDSRENKPQHTFRASAVCDLIAKYRKHDTKG